MPPTDFRGHSDGAVSTLASPRGLGASTFTVATGDGSLFNAGPGRLMLVKLSAWDSVTQRVTDRASKAILNYESRAGDVFSGVAAQAGTTDLAFAAGDLVIDAVEPADFEDIATAVNAIESATTKSAPGAALVYAGTDGTSPPSFRALVAGDIPALDVSKLATGVFPVTRGGTGVATLTGLIKGSGTGAFAAATAGTDYYLPGSPISASDVPSLDASKVGTGTLPPARGGTGLDGSAAPDGSLLIGNGNGYTLNTLTPGSGIAITNGAGSVTIAATGGGGGSAAAVPGWFDVSAYGAVAGLAVTSANVDANNAAFERTYQAAAVYTAATGRGAVYYIPPGDWLFSLPIWDDLPDMHVKGVGYASVLHQIGVYGNVGACIIVGQARIQNGEAIPDDTFVDASGILDTSMANGTYAYWGRRLLSLSQPTPARAHYHITFPNTVIGAFDDYWASCQQLTIEFAFVLNSGTLGSTAIEFGGLRDDKGNVPAPWYITTDGAGVYELRFRTDEIKGQAFRTVRWKPTVTTGLQRVAVMLDLAAGKAAVVQNGLLLTQAADNANVTSMPIAQFTVGVTPDSTAPTPAAFSGGVYRFRRNDAGYPFNIGSCNSRSDFGPATAVDITWFGFWVGNWCKYTFGTGGTAPVQDISGGDAPATINDAFRYMLWSTNATNPRQSFHLSGNYGPGGALASNYTGRPSVPCPQNNRLVPASFPGTTRGFGNVPGVALFERDMTIGSGQGGSQNSTSNQKVSDLTIQPYWGGSYAQQPGVLVGTCYEPRLDRLHVTSGFQSIGFMFLGTNYVNWVADCFLDGFHDCALYLSEGIGDVSRCRMGNGQVGILKIKGAQYRITATLASTGAHNTRAAVMVFHGQQGTDVWIDGLALDNEGVPQPTDAVIWADGIGSLRLRLSRVIVGKEHQNAPMVRLAEYPFATTPADLAALIEIDEPNLDFFEGRAIVVVDSPSWRGRLRLKAARNNKEAHSVLLYAGPDGTSNVTVEDDSYWNYPPNFGSFARGTYSLETPQKPAGMPSRWDVTATGAWGASSPSPRAAISAIGFEGDPAGPPAFRPRPESIIDPTGDALAAYSQPDDSIYAVLNPDPTTATAVYDYLITYGVDCQPLVSGPQAQYGRYSWAVHDAMNGHWLNGVAATPTGGTVRLGPSDRNVVVPQFSPYVLPAAVGSGTWGASSGGTAVLAADFALPAPTASDHCRFAISQAEATFGPVGGVNQWTSNRAILSALMPGFYQPRLGDMANKLAVGTGLVVKRAWPPVRPGIPRGSWLQWVWDAENNAWLNVGAAALPTPPADLYAGLCTIDLTGLTAPPDSGTILAAECSGGGYARVHVGLTNFAASNTGATANTAPIAFGTLSGALASPAKCVFLVDAASAGTVLWVADLVSWAVKGVAYAGKAGATPSFAAGALRVIR